METYLGRYPFRLHQFKDLLQKTGIQMEYQNAASSLSNIVGLSRADENTVVPPEDPHKVPLDAYLAVNCTWGFSAYTLHRTMESEMIQNPVSRSSSPEPERHLLSTRNPCGAGCNTST
jgi:hypothetical protein